MSGENKVIPLVITRTSIGQCCDNCECPDFSVVKDRNLGYLVVCDSCASTMGKLLPWEDE